MSNQHHQQRTQQVVAAIVGGELDDALEGIIAAARQRKRKIVGNGSLELGVGDRAILTGDLRPRYLIGLEVEVVKLNPKTVVVDVPADPGAGRFAGARNVRVPRTCIKAAA